MSQKLTPPIIILCIIYLLTCPKQSFATVTNVLVLWYQNVLPTLFPALLLVSMLTTLLKAPRHASLFCIATGFFCGFPLGCKTSCQYLENKTISKESALLFSTVFNQFSPVFLSSYVGTTILHCKGIEVILPLYLSQIPIIIGYYFLKIRKNSSIRHNEIRKAPQMSNPYQIVDASIIQSSETLIKIGGYMILCALLQSMTVHYTRLPILKYFLAPILEITSGISCISESPFSDLTKKILTLSSLSFGGLCGILQVSKMLHQASLSLKNYICIKLLSAICTAIISYLFFRF